MNAPKIDIPSLKETVVRNLSRIFPKEISDFTIHINFKGKEFILEPDEKDIIPRLATLITIGLEHQDLKSHWIAKMTIFNINILTNTLQL